MSKVENVDGKNSGFSENDKPLLLLDIDGVLNAYGRTYLDADAAERQHDDKYYQGSKKGICCFSTRIMLNMWKSWSPVSR